MAVLSARRDLPPQVANGSRDEAWQCSPSLQVSWTSCYLGQLDLYGGFRTKFYWIIPGRICVPPLTILPVSLKGVNDGPCHSFDSRRVAVGSQAPVAAGCSVSTVSDGRPCWTRMRSPPADRPQRALQSPVLQAGRGCPTLSRSPGISETKETT